MSKKFRLDTFYTKRINIIIDGIGPTDISWLLLLLTELLTFVALTNMMYHCRET